MPSKIRKSDLLSVLKSNDVVSGAQLSRELNISRQALHKRVKRLRAQGYAISGRPKSGYRLAGRGKIFIAEEAVREAATHMIGREIHFFESLESTQDVAKVLATRSAPEGAVVVAGVQTKGRGRMGRAWSSGEGGLWVSVLLRPAIQPQQVPCLSLAASLALLDAVRASGGVDARVKWPNDLWARPKGSGAAPFKKICGVLAEMSAEADRVHWVALGFGLNVNNALPSELGGQATTFKRILGRPVDRQKILSDIFKNLEARYETFLRKGFSAFRREYREKSLWRGREVIVADSGRETRGTYADVSEDGALVLELQGGARKAFYAGDVSLSPVAKRGAK